MTPGDRDTLEALNSRIDHTAAIARLLSDQGALKGDVAMAMLGIAETLTEIAERVDKLAHSA